MTYRLIQWATGNVGRHAVRAIIDRPDYELVGVRVYDPAKVDVDAGDLVQRPQTGVLATDDTEVILGLDADCVCYTALGQTLEDSDLLDDVCRLLASGKNVVSSAGESYAYIRPHLNLNLDGYERLLKACSDGQASFFYGGINPGFTMDLWPINLCALPPYRSPTCHRDRRLQRLHIDSSAGRGRLRPGAWCTEPSRPPEQRVPNAVLPLHAHPR